MSNKTFRLLTIPERQLDIDYIYELQPLTFINDHHNLVIISAKNLAMCT